MDSADRNRQNAASRNRYNAKAYQAITFRVRRDGTDGVNREAIQDAAMREGKSVNQFIIDALRAMI